MATNFFSVLNGIGFRTRAASKEATLHSVIRLNGAECHRLQMTTQIVQVICGCAWITLDGKDIIVKAGEEVCLYPGKFPAVISVACKSAGAVSYSVASEIEIDRWA